MQAQFDNTYGPKIAKMVQNILLPNKTHANKKTHNSSNSYFAKLRANAFPNIQPTVSNQ